MWVNMVNMSEENFKRLYDNQTLQKRSFLN